MYQPHEMQKRENKHIVQDTISHTGFYGSFSKTSSSHPVPKNKYQC